MKPLLLPWSGESVPHAILDINRSCNISCRGCYNTLSDTQKSLDEIEQELIQLKYLRRLHTITILGGEPSLHPQLEDIVRLANSHVEKVTLVSNGLLFDLDAGRRLKQAGLDLVLFHIDQGQVRSDLPEGADTESINSLRFEKAKLALAAGLHVGMQAIGYNRALDDVTDVVRFVIDTPGVSHLLVTNYTCVGKFKKVIGAVDTEVMAELDPERLNHKDEVTNGQVEALMSRQGYHPFAYVGAQHDLSARRWLSYQLCTITNRGMTKRFSMTSSLFERLITRLTYKLRGKYIFFFKPIQSVIRIQLLVNAVSGGRLVSNLAALIRSLVPGHCLETKHLVFQEGPGFDGEQLVICRDCPDATLKEGRLVPLCLTDKVVS